MTPQDMLLQAIESHRKSFQALREQSDKVLQLTVELDDEKTKKKTLDNLETADRQNVQAALRKLVEG